MIAVKDMNRYELHFRQFMLMANTVTEILNFEAFLRKSIYSCTTRLSSSSNKLICAIEQSWIMKSVIWKTWEEKMYI